MKTQKQCEDKLEEVVNNINKLVEEIPAEQQKDPTKETVGNMAVLVGMLSILAWVLDAEEEMKPLVRAMCAMALANKINETVKE